MNVIIINDVVSIDEITAYLSQIKIIHFDIKNELSFEDYIKKGNLPEETLIIFERTFLRQLLININDHGPIFVSTIFSKNIKLM